MQLNLECILCNVRQVLTVMDLVKAKDDVKEAAMRETLAYLAQTDYQRSNPEVVKGTWDIITRHIENRDPYKKIRHYYNQKMLGYAEEIERRICKADDPFKTALELAITANLIDFAAGSEVDEAEVLKRLDGSKKQKLAVDAGDILYKRLQTAKSLLYLGDNCGEVVIDKLFIRQIKKEFPKLQVYFGVRGSAIVNDLTVEDAQMVGMADVATVISNSDGSLGTVLHKTSDEFKEIFELADVVIAKGQGNYESLSEEKKTGLYYLFMAKCDVVAKAAGVEKGAVVCLENRAEEYYGAGNRNYPGVDKNSRTSGRTAVC